MKLKGVLYNGLACFGQCGDGGFGQRRRGVTTGGPDGIAYVHHTLFRNADHTAGGFYTGENIFHDCAAFVNHQRRLDFMLGKIPDNVGSTGTVNFFATGEGKINVIFRDEAVLDQLVCAAENAVHGYFGIQSATSPQNSVFYDTCEGRLFPAVLVDGNHIVMGHHHAGSGF